MSVEICSKDIPNLFIKTTGIACTYSIVIPVSSNAWPSCLVPEFDLTRSPDVWSSGTEDQMSTSVHSMIESYPVSDINFSSYPCFFCLVIDEPGGGSVLDGKAI